MGTVTITKTETAKTSYRATWTLSMSMQDCVGSGSVTLNFPQSMSAKYVYSGKSYGGVSFAGGFYITKNGSDTYLSVGGHYFRSAEEGGNLPSMTSGTVYTIPKSSDINPKTINMSSYFTSSNPTERSLPIKYKFWSAGCYSSNTSVEQGTTGSMYNYWYGGGSSPDYETFGTIATLTLDAPPQVTLGTPTYTTPHYAGLGTYSVPLTTLTAQYGGNITSVTLTIGASSITQTYSSSTVSNKTISVTPSVAGSYTPTLTVTDSRGQTTTTTFTAITVNAYAAPSLNFDVFRSNSSGIKDDEGAYGLITATVNFTDAIATLTQPAVTIDGTITNNVTWYSAYNSSTGIASTISDWSSISSGDTVYGLINGSFSGSQSYVVGMTVTDSEGGSSQTITQTLSTAFYTIDFQAGGKEIAFGAPANDDLTLHPNGLFKCDMDAWFNGDVHIPGGGSGTSVPTADTTAQWDSDVHMNSEDMTSQEVDDFVDSLNVSVINAVDYVVEEGTDANGWYVRKWNSGFMEATLKTNNPTIGSASSMSGVSRMAISLPTKPNFVTFRHISASGHNGGAWVSATINSSGNPEVYLLRVSGTVNTLGNLSVYLNGTWK